VERVVVHGDHAEQVIVVFGDGFPRPVAIDVADLEFLIVPAERTFMDHPCASASSMGASW
jgi:hypothetical protein